MMRAPSTSRQKASIAAMSVTSRLTPSPARQRAAEILGLHPRCLGPPHRHGNVPPRRRSWTKPTLGPWHSRAKCLRQAAAPLFQEKAKERTENRWLRETEPPTAIIEASP